MNTEMVAANKLLNPYRKEENFEVHAWRIPHLSILKIAPVPQPRFHVPCCHHCNSSHTREKAVSGTHSLLRRGDRHMRVSPQQGCQPPVCLELGQEALWPWGCANLPAPKPNGRVGTSQMFGFVSGMTSTLTLHKIWLGIQTPPHVTEKSAEMQDTITVTMRYPHSPSTAIPTTGWQHFFCRFWRSRRGWIGCLKQPVLKEACLCEPGLKKARGKNPEQE